MAIKKKEAPEMNKDLFEASLEDLEDFLSADTPPHQEPAQKSAKKPKEGPQKEQEPPEAPQAEARSQKDDSRNRKPSPGRITKKYSGDIVESILDGMVKKKLVEEDQAKEDSPQKGPIMEEASEEAPPSDTDLIRPGVPFLVRETTGELFALDQMLRIGALKDFANVFVPDNRTVSRRHAEVFLEKGIILVRDLGSRNGTFVNGVQIPEGELVPVVPGDILTFSDEQFVIQEG